MLLIVLSSSYDKCKIKLIKRINFYLQENHKICYWPEEICDNWQTPRSPTPAVQHLSCNRSRCKPSSDVQYATLHSISHKNVSADSRICKQDGENCASWARAADAIPYGVLSEYWKQSHHPQPADTVSTSPENPPGRSPLPDMRLSGSAPDVCTTRCGFFQVLKTRPAARDAPIRPAGLTWQWQRQRAMRAARSGRRGGSALLIPHSPPAAPARCPAARPFPAASHRWRCTPWRRPRAAPSPAHRPAPPRVRGRVAHAQAGRPAAAPCRGASGQRGQRLLWRWGGACVCFPAPVAIAIVAVCSHA